MRRNMQRRLTDRPVLLHLNVTGVSLKSCGARSRLDALVVKGAHTDE